MVISEGRIVSRMFRYPLLDEQSPEWRSTVTSARRQLEETGCCVLRDFVEPALQETLRAECASIAPQAYYTVETVNAYNIPLDAVLPDGHPGRTTFRRGNAFVARDLIPRDHLIHMLYSNTLFQKFVAACFGLPEIHELADPLAGLCLNVVRPGMDHPWHFDTNEFTVSLLTQQAQAGGVFQYCPNIRSAENENLPAVSAVIDGRSDDAIQSLVLRPGDLQLFKGRYSLHRVSAVEGETERHTAIFAYTERPGVMGSPERTRQLFGRVLPEHREADGRPIRGDQLLD